MEVKFFSGRLKNEAEHYSFLEPKQTEVDSYFYLMILGKTTVPDA